MTDHANLDIGKAKQRDERVDPRNEVLHSLAREWSAFRGHSFLLVVGMKFCFEIIIIISLCITGCTSGRIKNGATQSRNTATASKPVSNDKISKTKSTYGPLGSHPPDNTGKNIPPTRKEPGRETQPADSTKNITPETNRLKQQKAYQKMNDSTGVEKPLTDNAFAMTASEMLLTVVRLGHRAMLYGGSSKVREFGRLASEESLQANNKLHLIMKSKGIILPDSLCGKCKFQYESVSGALGKSFDRIYVPMMVKNYEYGVKIFSTESAIGEDQEIKNWSRENVNVQRNRLAFIKRSLNKNSPEFMSYRSY
jgi:hypothetical protein